MCSEPPALIAENKKFGRCGGHELHFNQRETTSRPRRVCFVHLISHWHRCQRFRMCGLGQTAQETAANSEPFRARAFVHQPCSFGVVVLSFVAEFFLRAMERRRKDVHFPGCHVPVRVNFCWCNWRALVDRPLCGCGETFTSQALHDHRTRQAPDRLRVGDFFGVLAASPGWIWQNPHQSQQHVLLRWLFLRSACRSRVCFAVYRAWVSSGLSHCTAQLSGDLDSGQTQEAPDQRLTATVFSCSSQGKRRN